MNRKEKKIRCGNKYINDALNYNGLRILAEVYYYCIWILVGYCHCIAVPFEEDRSILNHCPFLNVIILWIKRDIPGIMKTWIEMNTSKVSENQTVAWTVIFELYMPCESSRIVNIIVLSVGLTLIAGTQKGGFPCEVQRRPPADIILNESLPPKTPCRHHVHGRHGHGSPVKNR